MRPIELVATVGTRVGVAAIESFPAVIAPAVPLIAEFPMIKGLPGGTTKVVKFWRWIRILPPVLLNPLEDMLAISPLRSTNVPNARKAVPKIAVIAPPRPEEKSND